MEQFSDNCFHIVSMKKSTKTLLITQLVFAAVLLTTSVHAQFSAGIKAGVNLASEKYPGFTIQNAILGYGGAFVRYQVNVFALQLEANYSAEGGNLKDASNGDINKYRESYLNVPLLIQGRFPFGGYIEFGAQDGILLSSTYNYNDNGTVNTREMYKSNNFSVGGGGGYEFQKQPLKGLGINVRFMQGITAISSSGFGDIKTNTLSFGLSLKF
jgi:Outer membrane protein beta-barrel domain